MAKTAKKDFFRFRLGVSITALAVIAAAGLSVSGAIAQTWSEPTASPPSGNVSAPIWNQSAVDQSASFRINGTGLFGSNVGIGTSSTASLGAYQIPLTVTGSSYNFMRLIANGGGTPNTGIVYDKSNGTGFITALNNSGYFRFAPMATMDQSGLTNAKDGVLGITIDNSGNIGMGTASPAVRLHVKSGANNAAIRLDSASGVTNPGAGFVYMSSNGGDDRTTLSVNSYYDGASWQAVQSGKPSWLMQLKSGNSGGEDAFSIFHAEAGSFAFSNKFHINNAGDVGINNSNPAYSLDVGGTVNGIGSSTSGVQGTSAVSYGIYGSSASGAGVGGVSTSGYGIYGSSASSYAGYFNGPLNATGTISQNGIAVCLSDGTNCTGGSGGTAISSPEGMVTSTVYAYDNQGVPTGIDPNVCATEYGSGYRIARIAELAAHWGGGKGGGSIIANNSSTTTPTYRAYIPSAGMEYSVSIGSYRPYSRFTETTVGITGNARVFCIKTTAELMFTNAVFTQSGNGAVNGVTQTSCSTEFGNAYRNASVSDLAKTWTNGWGGAGTFAVNRSQTSTPEYWSYTVWGGDAVAQMTEATSGSSSVPLACVRIASLESSPYWTLNGTSLQPSNSSHVIKQNGVAVCLADGTNCPSSSSAGAPAETRLTRGTVLYNAALVAKDALCVSEFGADYWTASFLDIVKSYIKNKTYQAMTSSGLGFGAESSTYAYYNASTVSFSNQTINNGSSQVNCTLKKQALSTTRGTVQWNATLTAKDALCVSEFGPKYETANLLDIARSWGGTTDHTLQIYAGFSTSNNVVPYWGGGTWYWQELTINNGGGNVSCRMK